MTRVANDLYTTITASANCYLVPVGTENVDNAYLMGKPVKITFSNHGIIPAFTEEPIKHKEK